MDKPNQISRGVPMSLLNQMPVQNEFSVWFNDHQNKLVRVDLYCGNLSVSDAIKESIHKLNKLFHLNLKEDLTCYELYGAKKNGKRKSDFPSLEYEQIIQNTKLTKFHLYPLFPMNRKHSEQSTVTSIKSSMVMEKKSNKAQIQARKGFGCFFCGPN